MAQFYIISEKFTEKRQINSPHKLLQFRCLERVVGEGAHPELGEERVAQTHLCTPPFTFYSALKACHVQPLAVHGLFENSEHVHLAKVC